METIIDYLFNGTGWLIVAIVLIGLEFLAPGIYFMWIGFAALVLSGVTFIFPELAWLLQVFIFIILAVISVLIGKKYLMEKEVPSDDNTLNKRGQQYIGKVCEVVVPFKNGKGKIKIEDTLWTAIGPTKLEKGSSVKIIGQEGTRFKVEPVK